jgi:type I restriction enzyme S subunit
MNLESLRPLEIPVPPIELQGCFSARISAIQKLRTSSLAGLNKLDALFASLQHRAFSGELKLDRMATELAMAG